MPDHFLRVRISLQVSVSAVPVHISELFKAAASFVMRLNNWNQGTVAIESASRPGQFVVAVPSDAPGDRHHHR